MNNIIINNIICNEWIFQGITYYQGTSWDYDHYSFTFFRNASIKYIYTYTGECIGQLHWNIDISLYINCPDKQGRDTNPRYIWNNKQPELFIIRNTYKHIYVYRLSTGLLIEFYNNSIKYENNQQIRDFEKNINGNYKEEETFTRHKQKRRDFLRGTLHLYSPIEEFPTLQLTYLK